MSKQPNNERDELSERAASLEADVPRYERALLDRIADGHTHRSLHMLRICGIDGEYGRIGELRKRLRGLYVDDFERLNAAVDAMRARVLAAIAERERTLPRVCVGQRIHDDNGGGGGIVIAVDDSAVIYVSDTNEEGGVRLSFTNLTDVSVMEDVPPLAGRALQRLLQRFMPMPGSGRRKRGAAA